MLDKSPAHWVKCSTAFTKWFLRDFVRSSCLPRAACLTTKAQCSPYTLIPSSLEHTDALFLALSSSDWLYPPLRPQLRVRAHNQPWKYRCLSIRTTTKKIDVKHHSVILKVRLFWYRSFTPPIPLEFHQNNHRSLKFVARDLVPQDRSQTDSMGRKHTLHYAISIDWRKVCF